MTQRGAWCALWLAVACLPPAVEQVRAEYYVAGQIGVSFAVFTEYKYTRGTLTFSEAFGSTGGFSGDYRAQQVVFGVSYHF